MMSSTRLVVHLTLAASASILRAQTTPAAATPSPAATPARPVRAEAPKTRVDYVPQSRYDELRNWVVRSHAMGGTLFNSPDGQANYMMVLRSKPSEVEEHSRWDDLVIVRAGSGTVEVGRSAKGARFLSAGELRGGTITTPSRLTMGPGDIARIPAGFPHSFTPNGSDPWGFWLVKIRRPHKPLKRPPPDAKP
jgi:mannose-6-phosphate isomerase-like protein (cupin superfamily)